MKLRKEQQRYGPWICKKRPAGDWVVDQIDRETMRVRRYGPYPTEAEARAKLAELSDFDSAPLAECQPSQPIS